MGFSSTNDDSFRFWWGGQMAAEVSLTDWAGYDRSVTRSGNGYYSSDMSVCLL